MSIVQEKDIHAKRGYPVRWLGEWWEYVDGVLRARKGRTAHYEPVTCPECIKLLNQRDMWPKWVDLPDPNWALNFDKEHHRLKLEASPWYQISSIGLDPLKETT